MLRNIVGRKGRNGFLMGSKMSGNRKKILLWLSVAGGLIASDLLLAGASNGFVNLNGWAGFLSLLIIGVLFLHFAKWILQKEDIPLKLWGFVAGVVVLRLLLGTLFFVKLPQWGYGNPVEQAGYVMSDAYKRDSAAWELAQSEKSLLAAFNDYRKADQYGGLLFLSAAVYRLFGGTAHSPLQMVVVASFFSACSLLFTWAFVKRLWGEKAGNIAALIVGLYPDAMIIGSSQMREAFTITLAAFAIYGLILYMQDKDLKGWGIDLGAILMTIPLSPFFAVLLIGTLLLLYFFTGEFALYRSWIFLLVIIVAILLVGGLVLLLGNKLLPGFDGNFLNVIGAWFKDVAKWQLYVNKSSSGWIQKIFKSTPSWLHIYLVMFYGFVQPFLPAAFVATGKPIWKGIAIFRSIGWAFLLPILIYAPFRAVALAKKDKFPVLMSIAVWATIIVSSLRGGGDQWDNPRYRLSLLCLQAALAGWVLVANKAKPDPWLRRVVIAIGAVLLWFIPWYLRRYFHFSWPVVDVFKTLGLGVVTTILLWIYDWVRESR